MQGSQETCASPLESIVGADPLGSRRSGLTGLTWECGMVTLPHGPAAGR